MKFKHDQIKNESHRKSVSEACSNRIQQKISKEELNFLCKLQEFYGKENVVHKFKIEGVNHEYDFYVTSHNLIVEYDGDYWHGNPKNHKLTPTMKMQYHIDVDYTTVALNSGYKVHRVWASESHEYPTKLRDLTNV